MRKLVPLFVLTSMVALSGGAIAANSMTTGTTDAVTGSPTVTPNTSNPQGLSYSDKSNTSTGTNAAMDDKTKSMSTMDNDKKVAKKRVKKVVTARRTDAPASAYSSSGTNSLKTPTPAGGTNASTDNSTTGKTGQ